MDPEPVSGDVGTYIQADPWAHALGIRYLELRRGYCEDGTPVATAHCIAHRVST